MPKFADVAHVRSRTGAHIDTVADLNDTKFLHARWEEVHIGPVGGHDGVDFIPGHHGVVTLIQHQSVRWPLQ